MEQKLRKSSMGDDKYEILLERSVRATEQQAQISTGLLEVSKDLRNNMKQLNDNFVLHQKNDEEVQKELGYIKLLLLKYLKWAIITLILAVGGTSIVKFIIDANLWA